MQQISFSELAYTHKKKTTRKERFLAEMNDLLPWKPLLSRVGAGAPTVGSGDDSTAFAVGLSPAPLITFPTPATSNPACRLPAPGFPVDFLSRVMGPIVPEGLSTGGSPPDTRRIARVRCIATAYSTSSSQNPDLGARASDGV